MDPVTSAIVGALTAGAAVVGKAVASEAAKDAYSRLKALIASKFGRTKALEAVEEAPDSPSARAALEGALTETGAGRDKEIGQLATELANALREMDPYSLERAGIRIGDVTGYRDAIVRRLASGGAIEIDSIEARTGDAVVEDLSAGSPRKN